MKVKFNYQEWLKDKERKVVNEDGNEVFFYPYNDGYIVLVKGKAYNPEDAPIYFEVYDPSDETAKNTEVSDFAKSFQKDANAHEKKLVIDCSTWFISNVGVFGHYDFFTQKLWKNVNGFKDADEAEVIAAFLHLWFRYEYGFQNMPVGCAWASSSPSVYTEEDESFERYFKKWLPLFKAYSEWCYNRR